MTWQTFVDSVPIQVWAALGTAIVGAFVGLFLFLRWFFFTYTPRVLEDRVKAGEEKRKNDAKEAESEQQIKLLEIQNQLDQTQSGRQMNVLLISQMQTMQELFAKRDEQASKRDEQSLAQLGTISEALQGFQVVAASQFELLKSHTGSDKKMAENQEVIKDQNELTHRKLIEMSSTLDTIAQNLTALTDSVSQKADKSVLGELLAKLESIQDGIRQLEENTKPMPAVKEATINTVTLATNPSSDNTITISKEFDEKENSNE